MSDTPRTDKIRFTVDVCDGEDVVNLWFARNLERELNAANDHIKRLEEDLMDAKNKHAALVADVVLYEDRGERIKRLESVENSHAAVLNAIDNWIRQYKAKEAKP